MLTTTVHGTPFDEGTLILVSSVHDAACGHDLADLVLLIDPGFSGRTATEAIEELFEWSPEGAAFDSLAAVLETAATRVRRLAYRTARGVVASFPGARSRTRAV